MPRHRPPSLPAPPIHLRASAIAIGLIALSACGVDLDSSYDEVDPEMVSCIDRESERLVRQRVDQLVDALEADPNQTFEGAEIDSIEQLIAALPTEVRQQPLFFTETRAMARIYPREEREALSDRDPAAPRETGLDESGRWCSTVDGQDSHCLEARVLLPSVDGDVIGSFTTHPDSPSGDRFEMIIFDPVDSRLTLYDIDFGEGDLDGDGDVDPVVTENPETCMRCHGGFDGSVNYRFDPYRFWAYATPFNEDHIRGDSIELDWYMSFLDRIESEKSEESASGRAGKLGQLEPLNDLALFESGDLIETSTGSFALRAEDAAVDFSNNDSPALNLSHQLLERNACRVGADLARRDDLESIKYAAIGALIGCHEVGDIEIQDFFSPSGGYTESDAADHFLALQEGVVDGTFSYDQLLAEIGVAQTRLLSDRLSRRYDHYADFAGQDVAMEELRAAAREQIVAGREPGFGITDFEKYGTEIANARYLLEPLGVDVTNWSMAVDPTFQSHVEFLYPIFLQPALFSTMRQMLLDAGESSPILDGALAFCQDLTTKSPKPARQCRSLIQRNRRELCPLLVQASQESFRSVTPDPELLDFKGQPYAVEDRGELEDEATQAARCTPPDELTSEASAVLGNKCGQCHDTGYVDGSPLLPFRDIDRLEARYRREATSPAHDLFADGPIGISFGGTGKGPYAFEYIGTAGRIWDRVNRHPLVHGAMPPSTDGNGLALNRLSRDEKVTIRAHQLQVTGAVEHDGDADECDDDDDDGLPDLPDL